MDDQLPANSKTINLTDLPLEIIGHNVFNWLDLQSTIAFCFLVCKKLCLLPQFVGAISFSAADSSLLFSNHQSHIHEKILSKFNNLYGLECYPGIHESFNILTESILEASNLTFFKTLKSLRLPEFRILPSTVGVKTYFMKIYLNEHFFDELFPQLEELWLDNFFTADQSTPISEMNHWVSRLPKSLQHLRMKFYTNYVVAYADMAHPLEKMFGCSNSLRRLTTSTPRKSFPCLSYLNQLEYLCMEPCDSGDQNVGDPITFAKGLQLLPSSLTSLHITDRQIDAENLMSIIPHTVTELSVRIPNLEFSIAQQLDKSKDEVSSRLGEDLDQSLNNKQVLNHVSVPEITFPPQLKRLSIIGGAGSTQFFKLSHCTRLDAYEHFAVPTHGESYIPSIPVGQAAMIRPQQEPDDAMSYIFTFDSLPSTIRNIRIQSYHATMDDPETHLIVPSCIDFWTCFEWNRYFPLLQSLSISIPMFIESLHLLPNSLRSLEITLNPYKLPSDYEKLTTINIGKGSTSTRLLHLVYKHPLSRITNLCSHQATSQDDGDCGLRWTWPSKLERLEIKLLPPNWDTWFSKAAQSPVLRNSWSNILTDMTLQDSSSNFMQSLPKTLYKFSIRNLNFSGFGSFVIKILHYLQNDHSISWNPSPIETRHFGKFLASNKHLDFANINSQLLEFYASFLKEHAFHPSILVELDGYSEFDISLALRCGLDEALVGSCLQQIHSISIKPTVITRSTIPTLHAAFNSNQTHLLYLLTLSEEFRSLWLPRLHSLKTLFFDGIRHWISAVPFHADLFSINPSSIPYSLETADLFQLKLEKCMPNEILSCSSSGTSSQSISSSKSVFDHIKLKGLSVSMGIDWSNIPERSLAFVSFFSNLVSLKLSSISLEPLQFFNRLESLSVYGTSTWRYYEQWPSNIGLNWKSVSSTIPFPPFQSPLPPSLTSLTCNAPCHDLVLVGTNSKLKKVGFISPIRQSIIEEFAVSRSNSANYSDISFEVEEIYHSFSTQTSVAQMAQEFKSKFPFVKGNLTFHASAFQDFSNVVTSTDSNLESLPTPPTCVNINTYTLACQVQYLPSTVQEISFGPGSIIYGNPMAYLPSFIKKISLLDICVRYLSKLKQIDASSGFQLEHISITTFVVYNSEDLRLIQSPSLISNVHFQCNRLPRVLPFMSSNQFQTLDDAVAAKSLNFNRDNQFLNSLRIWFPNHEWMGSRQQRS